MSYNYDLETAYKVAELLHKPMTVDMAGRVIRELKGFNLAADELATAIKVVEVLSDGWYK